MTQAKPCSEFDRPDVLNFDVRDQRPFIGAQIAGDHFEAVTATQLTHHVADAGRRLQDRPDDLDFREKAGMSQGASSVK